MSSTRGGLYGRNIDWPMWAETQEIYEAQDLDENRGEGYRERR